MLIDDSTIKLNQVNPYNAATEKTYAAQRPSEARKKPIKRGTGRRAWAGFKQARMIGQWMNAGPGRVLLRDLHPAGASEKDLDFV
jgi:hypothetical protein